MPGDSCIEPPPPAITGAPDPMTAHQPKTCSLSALTCHDYAAHLSKNQEVVNVGGLPWAREGKVLIPLAMPHLMSPLDLQEVRHAMKRTKALVARWTDAWDTVSCSWWVVACDNPHYGIKTIDSQRRRRDIRIGLRRHEIRQVDPEWFSVKGYEVYAAAAARYGPEFRADSAEEFRSGVMRSADFSGRQTWGIFFEGRLVAFVSCLVYDNAVILSWIKSDPKYHQNRPNVGLWFEVTRHYLEDEKLQYVISGWRSLLHDTSIQEMMQTMGFRRIFCPLRAYLHPLTRAVAQLRADRWGPYLGLHKVAPAVLSQTKALFELRQIADECLAPSVPLAE